MQSTHNVFNMLPQFSTCIHHMWFAAEDDHYGRLVMKKGNLNDDSSCPVSRRTGQRSFAGSPWWTPCYGEALSGMYLLF